MAKQTINVGSRPNDGTGDSIRRAAIKINENFTENYTDIQNIKSFIEIKGPYANDAAAGTAGIPIGGLYYKSGGSVFVRLT
ncbi:hypothetical protein EBU71_09925 [bacterium]|nr:hypothetical protein [Candidatus Elulimicrobium humile]